MINLRPFLIAAAVLLLALAAYFVFRKNPEPTRPTPARSEQARQELQTQDKIDRAVWVADTLRRYNENKALTERLKLLTGKVATLQEKARQSAATYAKMPILANCTYALKDCQEHAAALNDVVSIQDSQLNDYEAGQRADRAEIARINAVKDSAFAGWGAAVQGWQQTEAELVKARKPKRIGIGLQAGYGVSNTGLTPFIGAGISYNLIRF